MGSSKGAEAPMLGAENEGKVVFAEMFGYGVTVLVVQTAVDSDFVVLLFGVVGSWGALRVAAWACSAGVYEKS